MSDIGRHARAKQLFAHARALPADRRSEWIAQACDDPALVAEVAELLQLDSTFADSDSELDGGDAAPRWDDGLGGRQLGQYRMLERIGSGGMGVVWSAEQRAPRRRVAIKLLRTAGDASPGAVLRRFHAESGLLAHLAHPHIAQVFEAGVFDVDGVRVPYFAMEYVAGARSITAWAEHTAADLDRRLELFVSVCDAVHHGHRRGVIHRDLKPDNILVDAEGRPKLIDFGVARMLDRGAELATLRTSPGQLIGTLQYMSPEQCAGDPDDLDTRSDVYSLGAVLFELATDRPAYDLSRETIYGATRRVVEDSPPAPSTLCRGLRRGLDAVVAKAMAKRRDDRYESAAALAADLRACLAGRPLAAQPPSAWRRLAGWVALHPFATTLALCTLLVLSSVSAMLLLARHYALLPDRVVVDADGMTVRLESRAGRTLHRWTPGPPIVEARMVPGPGDGGALALVACDISLDRSPHSGQVLAYAIDDPGDRPLWTTAAGLSVAMESRTGAPEGQLKRDCMLVADVLTESPGDELLVVHRWIPHDLSAIRVFDMHGRQRYLAWHTGALLSAEDLATGNRVVLAGLHSAGRWDQRGCDLEEWPSVVVALDLVDGHVGDPAGLMVDREVRDPTVAWYRWLGPPDALRGMGRVRLSLGPGIGRWSGRHHLNLFLDALRETRRVQLGALVIDASGREQHRWTTDDYEHLRAGGFPPTDRLALRDLAELPPIAH